MDIPWGDEKTMQSITNVGLITTDGPYGPDVMACEWTHQVSYRPALFSIHVNPKDATHENIMATKIFGISICATDQAVLSSIAGGNSGKIINKMKALEDLGFQFIQAREIPLLMVVGAAFWAECKLFDYRAIGDHTQFVGQAIYAQVFKDKEPLIYHAGKYWNRGEAIAKSSPEEIARIKKAIETNKK